MELQDRSKWQLGYIYKVNVFRSCKDKGKALLVEDFMESLSCNIFNWCNKLSYIKVVRES